MTYLFNGIFFYCSIKRWQKLKDIMCVAFKNFTIMLHLNGSHSNILTFFLPNCIEQCSATCGTGYRTKEAVCMRLYPKSLDNPHPIKNGTRVDPKYCAHMDKPGYEKSKKVCKNKQPCIHAFRWVIGPWLKVSLRTAVAAHSCICMTVHINTHIFYYY